jgi:hypothetical protein
VIHGTASELADALRDRYLIEHETPTRASKRCSAESVFRAAEACPASAGEVNVILAAIITWAVMLGR